MSNGQDTQRECSCFLQTVDFLFFLKEKTVDLLTQKNQFRFPGDSVHTQRAREVALVFYQACPRRDMYQHMVARTVCILPEHS